MAVGVKHLHVTGVGGLTLIVVVLGVPKGVVNRFTQPGGVVYCTLLGELLHFEHA